MDRNNRWQGLQETAQKQLEVRDYRSASVEERLATSGTEARELLELEGCPAWIPGVKIFPRRVFHQRHRGLFAEFARGTEGPLNEIGFWPQQWATARMYSGTAKGFHIHPPHIPENTSPEKWFQRLFVEEPEAYALRPYAEEQWDVMFFIQGVVEMLLIDERVGMPRKKMRFIIDGDDTPSANNAGVVIPAGVAHALRSGDSKDTLMVYGTSTTFLPKNEGRLLSSVEQAPLPTDWREYWERA